MIDPSTWTWKLRDSASGGNPDITFQYGGTGDKAVVGDWDGDGDTGIGVVNPGNGMWYLRQTPSAGNTDITPFQYGLVNGAFLTGDWDGDGVTGLASISPLNGPGNQYWYLINTPTGGSVNPGIAGATVYSQIETKYDANSNVLMVTDRERNHNDTGVGVLGTP